LIGKPAASHEGRSLRFPGTAGRMASAPSRRCRRALDRFGLSRISAFSAFRAFDGCISDSTSRPRLGQVTPDNTVKFAEPCPYADPEAAARKLIEIANSVEAVRDGRIHIELLNGPVLFELRATPAEYKAGLDYANPARLARSARKRHVRQVHPGGCGSVRMEMPRL
jgi:hypothetical protein